MIDEKRPLILSPDGRRRKAELLQDLQITVTRHSRARRRRSTFGTILAIGVIGSAIWWTARPPTTTTQTIPPAVAMTIVTPPGAQVLVRNRPELVEQVLVQSSQVPSAQHLVERITDHELVALLEETGLPLSLARIGNRCVLVSNKRAEH